MSWIQKIERLKARRAACKAEPLQGRVEAAVKGKESISSAALLDLLDLPKTVGSARRVAKIMHGLNFVPIRNRLLRPGGFRDLVCRGWSCPFRGEIPPPLRNPSAFDQT